MAPTSTMVMMNHCVRRGDIATVALAVTTEIGEEIKDIRSLSVILERWEGMKEVLEGEIGRAKTFFLDGGKASSCDFASSGAAAAALEDGTDGAVVVDCFGLGGIDSGAGISTDMSSRMTQSLPQRGLQ